MIDCMDDIELDDDIEDEEDEHITSQNELLPLSEL